MMRTIGIVCLFCVGAVSLASCTGDLFPVAELTEGTDTVKERETGTKTPQVKDTDTDSGTVQEPPATDSDPGDETDTSPCECLPIQFCDESDGWHINRDRKCGGNDVCCFGACEDKEDADNFCVEYGTPACLEADGVILLSFVLNRCPSGQVCCGHPSSPDRYCPDQEHYCIGRDNHETIDECIHQRNGTPARGCAEFHDVCCVDYEILNSPANEWW